MSEGPPPLPQQPQPKNWYKQWWGIVLITIFSLFAINGAVSAFGSDSEPAEASQESTPASDTTPAAPEETEEPAPEQVEEEPTPEPQAAFGTYGSDPVLDRLQDRCADGNMAACDELFADSPIDSEYETFGDTCGNRQAANTGLWCDESSTETALDLLYASCANGDMQACDDLYMESPLGSDYETFGDTCGNRQPPDTGAWCADGNTGVDEELHELVLELVWADMSARERAEICDGYNLFGPEFAYGPFAEGYGAGAPSFEQFRAFFDSKC